MFGRTFAIHQPRQYSSFCLLSVSVGRSPKYARRRTSGHRAGRRSQRAELRLQRQKVQFHNGQDLPYAYPVDDSTYAAPPRSDICLVLDRGDRNMSANGFIHKAIQASKLAESHQSNPFWTEGCGQRVFPPAQPLALCSWDQIEPESSRWRAQTFSRLRPSKPDSSLFLWQIKEG